jgi:hypothetical protein
MPHVPWFFAQACSVSSAVALSLASAARGERDLDWRNRERHQEEDTHTDNLAQLARCCNAGSHKHAQACIGLGLLSALLLGTKVAGTACLAKRSQSDDHSGVAAVAGTIPAYVHRWSTADMGVHRVQQDALSDERENENLTWAVMGSCFVQTSRG